MDYSGTIFGLVEQGIVDIDLNYLRIANSASAVSINADTITNATFIDAESLTPVIDDEEFKTIEFDLDIDYLGTEISDVLTVSGILKDSLDSV